MKSSHLRTFDNSFNLMDRSMGIWEFGTGKKKTKKATDGLKEVERRVCDIKVTKVV